MSRPVPRLPWPPGSCRFPAVPTTFTTPPRPLMARSTMASSAAISQRRPTRFASARPTTPSGEAMATSRRAGTGSSAPLMCTHSGSASIAVCSTSCAVDSDSITPPGGAADSIRCAKPDRLAGRGVAQRPRTDVACDHPTRIQTHPQLQRDSVAARYLGRQLFRIVLDGERRKACPKSVILQRNWGAEQRHHPVAVVFDGPAVALDHCQLTGSTKSVMISRNRSRSMRAAMSIDRTTSANSTVTCLYFAVSGEPRSAHRTRRRTWRRPAGPCRTTRKQRPPPSRAPPIFGPNPNCPEDRALTS